MAGRRSSVSGRQRCEIAAEAARLMYEESVSEYMRAKKMAVRRLFGRSASKWLHGTYLPSNGEIQAYLRELADLHEGQGRIELLFRLRSIALRHMRALTEFSPRLIGSVATGHARRGSDIDLHVFTEDLALLEARMRALDWHFSKRTVTIRRKHAFVDYHHYDIEDDARVEITVQKLEGLRERPRSSTDGKPMLRLDIHQLRALLELDHPTASDPERAG